MLLLTAFAGGTLMRTLFQDSTSSGVSLFLAAAALISRVWAGHAGKAHEVDSVPDEDEDLRLSLVYT